MVKGSEEEKSGKKEGRKRTGKNTQNLFRGVLFPSIYYFLFPDLRPRLLLADV